MKRNSSFRKSRNSSSFKRKKNTYREVPPRSDNEQLPRFPKAQGGSSITKDELNNLVKDQIDFLFTRMDGKLYYIPITNIKSGAKIEIHINDGVNSIKRGKNEIFSSIFKKISVFLKSILLIRIFLSFILLFLPKF